MDNIINLNSHRKTEAPVLPENTVEMLDKLVNDYVDAVYENCPIGLIEMYAKDAIEMEIRNVPFDVAFEIIEKEFPEIAGQFKKDMSL